MSENTDTYLLDTHAWVWIVEGSSTVKNAPVLENIEQASEQSRICIASISLWEIAMLEAKGRIQFSIPCLQWIINALKAPGLTVVPSDPVIAADSAHLPALFHGDPADRMIVATARKINAILVTRDREILSYAAYGHLRTAAI